MLDLKTMDIEAILKLLPHRYPFLLVDRVLECKAGESVRALKNVTYNEPFFPGHFPHRPVMPGVMIIEALAQACGILTFATVGNVPTEDRAFTSSASTTRASASPSVRAISFCCMRSWKGACAASGNSRPSPPSARSRSVMRT